MNQNITELKALRAALEESNAKAIAYFDAEIEKLAPLNIQKHIESKLVGLLESLYNTNPILSKIYKNGNVKPSGNGRIGQVAALILVTGLEELQKTGKEQMIDLLDARIEVAKNTLLNKFFKDIYSRKDKSMRAVPGLLEAVPEIQTSSFDNIISDFKNQTACVRDSGGKCDLIIAGQNVYEKFVRVALSRETDEETANRGFLSITFGEIPVVLEIEESGMDPNQVYFLDTNYLELRPHKSRNFVPLDLGTSTNQNPSTHAIVWAGEFISTKPCHRLLEMKAAV